MIFTNNENQASGKLTEVGRKPENCVTFYHQRTVSRDLLKIFEFCKMFWIANNACDIINRKNYLYLSYGSYQGSRTVMLFAGNCLRTSIELT